jgi:hypothetical protein
VGRARRPTGDLGERFVSASQTEFYADLLAGVVSKEAPEPIDVESFLATLQSLSVEEIKLARKINAR